MLQPPPRGEESCRSAHAMDALYSHCSCCELRAQMMVPAETYAALVELVKALSKTKSA